jgi:hypothetical protein
VVAADGAQIERPDLQGLAANLRLRDLEAGTPDRFKLVSPRVDNRSDLDWVQVIHQEH